MKLTNAILVIRWATIASGLVFLLALIAYLSGLDLLNILAYALLMMLAILILLSKKWWLKYLFRTIKYPGLLYGLCDRLNLIGNLDNLVNDAVLDDLYKPAYSTEAFLADNGLTPEVYPAAPGSVVIGQFMLYAVPISFLIAGTQIESLKQTKFYLLSPLSLLVCTVWRDYIRYQKDPDAGPMYIFSEKGLETADGLAEWNNIYDWQLLPAIGNSRSGERKYLRLRIDLKEMTNDRNYFTLNLDEISIRPIQFYMMLIHYQYKYGYGRKQ